MPPKNKGKKGKKADDDFWYVHSKNLSHRFQTFGRENAGETVAPNLSAPNYQESDGEDIFAKKQKSGFSALASAGLTDDIAADVSDDDGGGGLMVRFYLRC